MYNEIKTISVETEIFPEENLQHFVKVDDALWANKELNDEKILKTILNASEDENENSDETEEIVY